ncbi:MAG TPA: endo-1,4-beta-xylanase [Bacteroidales bacterium]|nr:endo-1,4-beta-xylanase [Bacteroidales bacterium]HPF02321.1 endo-1,4-beta-xylanase [Bacteroidales bacterium]HPJ58957.1 endo-1,4-beta-xylanase [Bacteroidales bacterium]HPR12211.1 endo-1,4-beta-xylanase [Bacteroidales bacterium]HRW85855.1 endo-1,4-beta-xylanase [Bacteroidales bacterium]
MKYLPAKAMRTSILKGLYIISLAFAAVTLVFSQTTETDGNIEKYRKGEIIVRAKRGTEIKIEQIRHEFWFGCAITNSIAGNRMSENDKTQFKKKFLENFNSAVTENAVKWDNMERRRGEVNYSTIDGILAWTEENNIPLRGHNLFWGVPKWVPQWVKELDDRELRQTLQNRAETITKKYKGRFAEYDLNNEMIHGNYFEERLGPEITKLMAEWSHKGDPDARLWLNDYDILTGNRLADYMTHIRTLLRQGVPIAGIGVQGHLHGETFDRKALKNALDSVGSFGIPVRITEFNIPGQRSKYYEKRNLTLTPVEEEQKARELTDYYRICFAHPAVEGILMWGFWEGANWIPQSSLYRHDWSPTPAAEAYRNLVFNEWWTKTTVTAGRKGVISIPAYYGEYRITANGEVMIVELKKKEGKVLVDLR